MVPNKECTGSHDPQTPLSMPRLQEVVTEHAQSAKLLHFLFSYYKYPTQGASFHRVARLYYRKHLLHVLTTLR